MIFLLVLIPLAGLAIYLLGMAASWVVGFALQGRSNQKRWQLLAKYVVIVGIPVWLITDTYLSLNPNDDFYLREFKNVTLQEPPRSAKVAAKSASLFGLHSGEACSYARIEISQQDYSALHKSIDADPRFKVAKRRYEKLVDGKIVIHEVSEVLESDNQHNVHNATKFIPEKSSYVRHDPNNKYQHNSLLFLADEKHIEVNSCR
jgi:hypothetical protein